MFPLLVIVLAFGLDRLSKWWAAAYLAERGPIELHPLLSLQPTYNRGIAFGLAQGIGPIVGWLSLVVVIGLLIYLMRLPRSMRLMRVGLALLIGGALGNLVDRVTAGQVLDFIISPIRPGIFNVADVLIYGGLFLAVAGALLNGNKEATSGEAVGGDQGAPVP